MRKTREILRLAYEVKIPARQIARSLHVSPTTVGNCLERAREAGITWPLPEEMEDGDIEELLYGEEKERDRPLPDMRYLRKELSRKGVTLMLLWEEYLEGHPDDHYSYSQFCRVYRAWAGKLEISMHQDHKAGEKAFIDFAGQTIPVVDPATGEITRTQVFVAAMGFSSYTYVEACPSQELPHWTRAHKHAFEFFGGVPHILTPDNLKSGITHPCRYEPDINPTYDDMATHYGCCVIPARVRRPKDKAKVESGVLQAERRVIAPLRNRTFHSIAEVNEAIAEQVEFLNNRKMKHLDQSRAELFREIDRPALLPLPEHPYEFAEWKKRTVNIDYHVELDRHYYSVHYRLIKEKVDVRYTSHTVEIFHEGRRVASHARSFRKGGYTTVDDHMPASHKAHLEWSPSRIISWAGDTGPATAELVAGIMERRPHPEQGYRSCLGIVRLGGKYGSERMETAAKRAVGVGAFSYGSVKSILETGIDRLDDGEDQDALPLPEHDNVRGPDYYN